MTYPHYLNYKGEGPTLWTDLPSGYGFCVVVDAARNADAWRVAPDGITWTTTDLSTEAANALGLPCDDDPHNYMGIATDADGIVHVTGNMHNQAMRMIKSNTALTLTGAWTDETADFGEDPADGISYPAFLALADGTLLFHYRIRAAGDQWSKYRLWKREAGGGWTHVVDFVSGTNGVCDHAYPFLWVGADDYVHAVGTWNPDAAASGAIPPYVPGNLWRRDPWYMRSPDGGATWEDVNGASVATPLLYANRAQVSMGAVGESFLNTFGSLDQNSNPDMNYTGLDGSTWRIRWGGASWATFRVLTAIPSALIPIQHQGELWYLGNNGRSYLTRRLLDLYCYVSKHDTGPDNLYSPTIPDPQALKDGLIKVLGFDEDGVTPQFRTVGAGLRYNTP